MKYLTHIPKFPHVQRERMFFAGRVQARESVLRLGAVQDMLVRACTAHLRRNDVDAGALARCGRQIVKLSKDIRELGLVARQPNPPRHEPATATRTKAENRLYAGVKASRLVRVLDFIRNFRTQHGEARTALRILKMSDRLVRGLDVYGRVKALIRTLSEAVDNPAEAITLRSPCKKSEPVSRDQSQANGSGFKWETSPQQVYGWKFAVAVKGYDPRSTNVYWLEKQAVTLKRAIYRDYHGLETPRTSPAVRLQKPEGADVDTRAFIAPEEAQRENDIWPPIDLVRMVEERRDQMNAPAVEGEREIQTSKTEAMLSHHQIHFDDTGQPDTAQIVSIIIKPVPP